MLRAYCDSLWKHMYIMSKAYFDSFVEIYVMSKHIDIMSVGGHVHYVKAYFDNWRTCTLCQSILWQLGDLHIMSKHTLTVGGHVHYVKAYFDSWGDMHIMSKHTLIVGGHVHYVKAYFDSWGTCTLCQSILWQLEDMYIMSKHTLTVGGHVHYVKAYFDS